MSLIHLRSATTSFVAVNDGDALPIVLHWGARLPDDSYLDPMSLLTGLRVRLLPWTGRGGP